MPLDFRYHLASLAAVFGALVIGILLGVAMKEGPALSNQVKALRAEFQRAEALKDIDQRTDRFNAQTQRILLDGRLYGRNIALVCNPTPNATIAVEALRQTLESAGASVTVEVTVKPAMAQLTQEQMERLAQKMGLPRTHTRRAPADLLRRLALEIGVSPANAVKTLEQAKLITVNGEPSRPISSIIFLGGASDTGNYIADIDMPFLRACTDRRITVAAAEPLETPYSAIKDYQKVAPITIDNIDRAAGRIALAFALATGQNGNFGYKPTADDVAPELE